MAQQNSPHTIQEHQSEYLGDTSSQGSNSTRKSEKKTTTVRKNLPSDPHWTNNTFSTYNTSQDPNIHDQRLDQSSLFLYPEEPESVDASWIRFEESEDECQILDPDTEKQTNAILGASLSTIFGSKRTPVQSRNAEVSEVSKLSEARIITTTNSSVDICITGINHCNKQQSQSPQSEPEKNNKKGLEISITVPRLVMVLGFSFSFGYLVGLQAYRFLKAQSV